VQALADYATAVEQGLGVCLRLANPNGVHMAEGPDRAHNATVDAVVFGSDQGLVSRFNEQVIEHAIEQLALLSPQVRVWAVGERVHARLLDAGLRAEGVFAVPGSVQLITQLVAQILLRVAAPRADGAAVNEPALATTLMLFYNRHTKAGSAPVGQRLLPLDGEWQRSLALQPWPTAQWPEALGRQSQALGAFVREHLFVSLFRACAESLASENASRLAAMQRADRNIGELLTDLSAEFHRLRQSGIDEELFEVIAGFDALAQQNGSNG